jgi:hypothetical protein
VGEDSAGEGGREMVKLAAKKKMKRVRERGTNAKRETDKAGEGDREREGESVFVIESAEDRAGERERESEGETEGEEEEEEEGDGERDSVCLLKTSPSHSTASASSLSPSQSAFALLCDVLTCGITSIPLEDYQDSPYLAAIEDSSPYAYEEAVRARERQRQEDFNDETGQRFSLSEKITRLLSSQIGPFFLKLFASSSLEEVNSVERVQKALRVLLQDESLFVREGFVIDCVSGLRLRQEVSEIERLRERVQLLEREVSRLEIERNSLAGLSCGVV